MKKVISREESDGYGLAFEVPDELAARYARVLAEFDALQNELEAIYKRGDRSE